MSNRITQRELNRLINNHNALNINKLSFKDIMQLRDDEKGFDKIAISFGSNGMNGALLQGCTTNKLYAITKRTSNLLILV